ncbi:divalent-cation tolerance protein CutA [Glycomyces buryatensis]|uniref:Divalent-cation tolerance protein CutA n=1 Tax=Glycomyces buryatensis TaxID=2570927 RepID=A0A4S8QCE4_9ACTN|nr:divalent-cation tolerance protein CutA [Glycomyces buryatensis]THV41251.1 divalent-cation tolerance protein CutA [Glycomyces buryatensis]
MAEATALEPICEVVVTGPRTSLMQQMAEDLVNERLVACAQRVDPIRSTFRWNGGVDHQVEERVCFHTRASLVPVIVLRVKALHPYDVPCVLAFPVMAVNPAYHAWVITETAEADTDPTGPA